MFPDILTTLIPDKFRRHFLVIGCGAGVTAGAVSVRAKTVESRDLLEMTELPVLRASFPAVLASGTFNVVTNPGVHVEIDDARHFLMTTKLKFDGTAHLIPLDPWVKGAAMLYTREFFDAAKAHLTPGGVVTLFVQFYESNEDAVKSEVATFFEAFPHGAIFANTIQGQGYDVVMLGQNEEQPIDVSRR